MAAPSVDYATFITMQQGLEDVGGPWRLSSTAGTAAIKGASSTDGAVRIVVTSASTSTTAATIHPILTAIVNLDLSHYPNPSSISYTWTYLPFWTQNNKATDTFHISSGVGVSTWSDNFRTAEYTDPLPAPDQINRVTHSDHLSFSQTSGTVPVTIIISIGIDNTLAPFELLVQDIKFEITESATTPASSASSVTSLITTGIAGSTASTSGSTTGTTNSTLASSSGASTQSRSSGSSTTGSGTADPAAAPSAGVPTQSASNSTSISTGAIVGIGVGIVGLLAIVAALFFCWRRRRREQQADLGGTYFDKGSQMMLQPWSEPPEEEHQKMTYPLPAGVAIDTPSQRPYSIPQQYGATSSIDGAASTRRTSTSKSPFGRTSHETSVPPTTTTTWSSPQVHAYNASISDPPSSAQRRRAYTAEVSTIRSPRSVAESLPIYEESSQLALWARENREIITEGLEAKLTYAGYVPTDDPDIMSQEMWLTNYGVSLLELTRLRNLYADSTREA